MKKVDKTPTIKREAIVAEYLLGATSYRVLGKKHGIDYRIVHSWVTKFQGKPLRKPRTKLKLPTEPPKLGLLPTEVKVLQEELRKAKLYNELLNTMIDIAENELKINIRKKSGTKQ